MPRPIGQNLQIKVDSCPILGKHGTVTVASTPSSKQKADSGKLLNRLESRNLRLFDSCLRILYNLNRFLKAGIRINVNPILSTIYSPAKLITQDILGTVVFD